MLDQLSYINDGNQAILEKDWPPMLGNIFQIIRFSMGDFDFGVINTAKFGEVEVTIFWVAWLLIVLITNIIFLNFIIAEVGQSYQFVQSSVNQLILQERASLISESEDMLGLYVRNNKIKNPECIIVREVET